MKKVPVWYWTIVLCLFALSFGLLAPELIESTRQQDTTELLITPTDVIVAQQATATQTSSPPQTPNTTLTSTLLPPPTIEPPTPTLPPSATPSPSPTQPILVEVTVEGLQGLPTPTSALEEVCEPIDDWKLRYEVQTNETLSQIADKFGTNIWTLAEANCLEDMNMIRVGQQLRVPGDSMPQEPEIVCGNYQVLQPIDRASGIPANGQIVFVWTGPEAPRNLLRLYPPDYDFNVHDPSRYIDVVFDLRQNETVNLADLPEGGKWHWQIFPLDWGFQQVCPEGPLWSFHKEASILP